MGVLEICARLLVAEKCSVQVQWENLYVTVNYYLIFRLCPTGEKYPNIFKIEKTCTHKIICPIERTVQHSFGLKCSSPCHWV